MKLGELEKLVLNYFWEVDTADAKEVYAQFKKQRGGTLNTIQSTLDRLFKKGLLKREKESYAFRYKAAKKRKQFIGELVKDVTKDFTHENEDSLFTAFTSLSDEFNEDQIEQLEILIQDYKKNRIKDEL
jgi:predicted transcriptional regulator